MSSMIAMVSKMIPVKSKTIKLKNERRNLICRGRHGFLLCQQILHGNGGKINLPRNGDLVLSICTSMCSKSGARKLEVEVAFSRSSAAMNFRYFSSSRRSLLYGKKSRFDLMYSHLL